MSSSYEDQISESRSIFAVSGSPTSTQAQSYPRGKQQWILVLENSLEKQILCGRPGLSERKWIQAASYDMPNHASAMIFHKLLTPSARSWQASFPRVTGKCFSQPRSMNFLPGSCIFFPYQVCQWGFGPTEIFIRSKILQNLSFHTNMPRMRNKSVYRHNVQHFLYIFFSLVSKAFAVSRES